MYGEDLPQGDDEKDLGVIFDCDLKFSSHVAANVGKNEQATRSIEEILHLCFLLTDSNHLLVRKH